jgi:hypothetical protein
MLKQLLKYTLLFAVFTNLSAIDLKLPTRKVPSIKDNLHEYYYQGKWHLIDEENDLLYLSLDNKTLASYEDVADDPFLALRTNSSGIEKPYNSDDSRLNFASFNIFPDTFDCSDPDEDPLTSPWDAFTIPAGTNNPPSAKVVNTAPLFDHETPYFLISCDEKPDFIHWEISSDKNFPNPLPNFRRIEKFTDLIALDRFTDTFFNKGASYFFHVKTYGNGQWSDWSEAFEFAVDKPASVTETQFNKINENQFEISWKRAKNDETQYLIFASNAFDFIPSIYTEKNEQEEENFLAKTAACSIKIGTDYAFYRVVAECKGQYAVPSPIIRVYDRGLSIPRTVLQAHKNENGFVEYVRIPFPKAYPNENGLDLQLSGVPRLQQYAYPWNPYVDSNVWHSLEPFLLPENHPVKPKLDRFFSTRVTETQATLKAAGFEKPKPMRASKTIVSRNKNVPGYIFKFFADEQKNIVDWKKCLARVAGSLYIQAALDKYEINHLFLVPKKYLYPLPIDPAPKVGLVRKNYIVIENEIDIYDYKANNKMWKDASIIDQTKLNWLFRLLSELGLSDSVFAFNLPISKDKRISFIDTEHHHEWPIPFYKLEYYLSSKMKDYWYDLAKKNKTDRKK